MMIKASRKTSSSSVITFNKLTINVLALLTSHSLRIFSIIGQYDLVRLTASMHVRNEVPRVSMPDLERG
jgi:hypothetical protein